MLASSSFVHLYIYIYMSYMCMSHMKYMLYIYIFAFIVYTLRYPQISWGPVFVGVSKLRSELVAVARWSRAWTWGEGDDWTGTGGEDWCTKLSTCFSSGELRGGNQGQLVLWSVYIPASSSTGAVWILRDGVIFRDLQTWSIQHPERKIHVYILSY